jgi:hypothetical protein
MKPQTSGLLFGKLKHKVLREPVGVALNGKIQGFGRNAVKFGQVCIEHHLLGRGPEIFAARLELPRRRRISVLLSFLTSNAN